jgi:D-arabinono-1,4-lactone oxidase/FAD binding domain
MQLEGGTSGPLTRGPVVEARPLRSALRRLRIPFSRRETWSNDLGNQHIDPLREYSPTRAELPEIITRAEADGTTVRAVGSGHSWSDVALASGFLIRPDNMASGLDLEEEVLKPRPEGAPPLARAEAGMTIAAFNDFLRDQGLGLPNMGGFDGQTLAGATSTSTHGSGHSGPMSDFVKSLDMVAANGARYRIEPADGPTDRVAFERLHPDRELVQDDSWFRAAVVGMGSMGVVESMYWQVRSHYFLREVRTMTTWDKVREDLQRGDVLKNNDHYEVLISPYPRDGKIECLVTTRNEIPEGEYRHDFRRTRNWLTELMARFPLTPVAINFVSRLFPKIAPTLLHMALTSLENPDYVNESDQVFNIGAANYLPAYSAEIGVPVDRRGLHLKAVEDLIAVAAKHRELGNTYHSSPISLRFVRGTDSYLSMMEGRDTMMIELIMLRGTKGGMELLADEEDTLFHDVEGRPHWGQVNHLTRDRIEKLYPHYAQWLEIESRLNKSGVFNSPFTRRVGISA